MKMPFLTKDNEDTERKPRHGFRVGRTSPLKARRKAAIEGWRIRAVVNHVTFIGDGGVTGEDRMIAWYLADPTQWSFRSVGEGESLIIAGATQLSELAGSTVYYRVTTRPYPVSHWARNSYANAADPQPGFVDMMDRDQQHAASAAQVDKLVYYGVDLGARGTALTMLGKVYSGAVDREMKALQDRLDAVDSIMRGGGLDASPAQPEDMEWLLARSFALGCPVPVPSPEEAADTMLDADDLAAFAETAQWDAEPLDPTVRITTTVGARQVTRHVCILTVSRTSDISIPENHEPWMSKADKLPFGLEWFGRVDVRTPEEVSREVSKLSNRIDAQVDHWEVDHRKRPPRQLGRQARLAAAVEDDMRTGFDGLSTRTRSWFRIAVSGETREEALDRAQAVIDHYKPQIQIVRELGQYHLAREFVPGEPLATTAHARKWPVLKVASGLPAISAEVGDRRGFQIGETAGLSRRMVAFDPWYLPEVMNSSGLIPVTGTLGSGKSVFGGALAYKATLSGARGVALDPAGRLQQMIRLPELENIARSINLLGGAPGSLSPYGVVPDPNPELVRMDCDNPDDEDEFAEKMRLATSAAKAARKDLCIETLRWCLPYEVVISQQGAAVMQLLRQAVLHGDDRVNASATDVINRLRGGTEEEQEVAKMLDHARDQEIGRLFFHETGARRGAPNFDDDARLTVFNLRGLTQPDPEEDIANYSADELLARPVMRLASWASLNLIYRRDPNERKFFLLDEAHEVTEGSGAGRALVTKISTDSRKNNTAAVVLTQNAASVLGTKNIRNFVGACFVGRAGDEEAQRDALTLLGKPHGVGYEAVLGNLSPQSRRKEKNDDPFKEFIFRDGLGGDGGRGGMEKIRVDIRHHPELFAALRTNPDGRKARRAQDRTDEVA